MSEETYYSSAIGGKDYTNMSESGGGKGKRSLASTGRGKSKDACLKKKRDHPGETRLPGYAEET